MNNNLKEISRTFMAMFGDPIRIQMLELLMKSKEGITPTEMAKTLFPEEYENPDKKAIALSRVSSHLSVFNIYKITISERRGKNNLHRINPNHIHKDKLKIENYLIQID